MSVYRVKGPDGTVRETNDQEEFQDLVNLLTDADRDFETEVEE